jgi:hypothetical protein
MDSKVPSDPQTTVTEDAEAEAVNQLLGSSTAPASSTWYLFIMISPELGDSIDSSCLEESSQEFYSCKSLEDSNSNGI